MLFYVHLGLASTVDVSAVFGERDYIEKQKKEHTRRIRTKNRLSRYDVGGDIINIRTPQSQTST